MPDDKSYYKCVELLFALSEHRAHCTMHIIVKVQSEILLSKWAQSSLLNQPNFTMKIQLQVVPEEGGGASLINLNFVKKQLDQLLLVIPALWWPHLCSSLLLAGSQLISWWWHEMTQTWTSDWPTAAQVRGRGLTKNYLVMKLHGDIKIGIN